MFLKRLSTALLALVCFGGFVLGTNPATVPNANQVVEENMLAAPLEVSFILTPHSPRCNGESNGSIDVQINLGFLAPFSYQLQYNGGPLQAAVGGQPQSFTINNLKAGTYTVYITDNSGDTGNSSVTLVDFPDLEVYLESPVIQPACSGGSSDLLFEANGGDDAGYTYQLFRNSISDGSNANGDFFSKGDGVYSLIVTDQSGCQKNYSNTIQITVPKLINFSYNIVSQINCDNGFASVDFNNLPVDPFTIQVHNNDLNVDYTAHDANYVYSNLQAGAYTTTVTRNSCTTDVQNINFTIDPFEIVTLSTSPASPVDLSCGGVTDLTDVDVTVNGGKAGLKVHIVFDNNNGLSDDQEATINYDETATFPNIKGGTYTIRWNDVNDASCSGSMPFVINAPATPLEFTSNPVQDSPSCYGENNGTVDFTVTGGIGSYTYWVDGNSYSTKASIILNPGNHNLYVEDQNGCTTETQGFLIDQTPELNLSIDNNLVEQLSCVNGNNGKIVVNTTGGNPPYRYTVLKDNLPTSYVNWQGGADVTFSGLSEGVYQISVEDGICSAIESAVVEIDELEPITITNFLQNPSVIKCRDEIAELIFVQAHGGPNVPFTYSLFKNGRYLETKTESGHEDGVPFYSITPANYVVWVKYNGACDSIAQQINIYNPDKFVLNFEDTISLSCNGDNILLPVTGSGESPFSYTIGGVSQAFDLGAGTSVEITNLNVGANTITFEDRLGCQQIKTVLVEEPDEINVTLQTPNPKVNCVGASDAVVTLQVTGGTPAFEVEILGSGKSARLTDNNGMVTFNLPAGIDYDVKVTDIDKACVKTFTAVFTVTEPAVAFNISEINIEQQALLCFGDSTRVEVNVAGGWGGNKEITVSGGAYTNKVLPANGVVYLKAGTYNFKATDLDYGCIATRNNVAITQPKNLVLSIINSHNVSCFGAEDADIALSISGGTAPYYWGVNGVATIDAFHQFNNNTLVLNDDLVPLPKGTYDIVIQDENGCASNIKQATIAEPEPITFDFVADSFVTCSGENDGTIRILNPTGGTKSGYQTYYSLSGGADIPDDLVISDLTAGTYSVRVVNIAVQCSSDPVDITINDPTQITWTGAPEVEHIKCYGINEGSIRILAAGGLPYSLEYRITRGSTFDTGYSSNNEFNDLAPGTYKAWVRNAKGNCAIQYPSDIVINNVLPLSITSTTIVDVSCFNEQDGSIQINATGGTGQLTYTLTNALSTIANNPNNNGSFTGLGDANKSSTTYNYLIEDANQCAIEGSFTIVNPPQIAISLVDATDVLCHNEGNGTITVSVTGGVGGYVLSDLNNPAVTLNVENASADEYKITDLGTTAASTLYLPSVADKNGCVATLAEELEIINPAQLRIDKVVWGDKLCYGDNTDSTIIYAVGGTGSFRYSLDDAVTLSVPSDSIFVGEEPGTKFPFVIDENNCTAKADEYEYVQPDPLNVFYSFSSIKCYDDQYADMALQIVGGTGPYYLSINDPNFATNVANINAANTDTTEFELLENNVFLVEETRYRFYLRDENNCHVDNVTGVNIYSKEFADTIFSKPQKLVLIADSLSMKPVTCSGDQTGIIKFAATGGTVTSRAGYTLNAVQVAMDYETKNKPFSNYVENLFAGLHHVYLTDANGCQGETRLSNIGWNYDTITVAYKNVSLKVNVSDITLPTCNDTYDGKLEVDVEDFTEEGGTAYVQYLDSTLGLFYDFDDEDSIVANRAFLGTTGLYTLNNIQIAEGMGIGTYRVTVVDNYTNCTATLDTTLFSTYGDSCPPTYFYNVFTPNNGDDLYENWTVFGSQHQKYTLQIYTSWGELIYTDKGIADGDGVKWNGVDKYNNPVPVGTYIYLLHKNEGTPRDTLINGNVTIIRGDGRW